MELKNNKIFIKFLITGLLCLIQKKGNKEVIEIVLKKNLSMIKKIIKCHPMFILLVDFKKVKPFCDLRSLKINGKIYKIPVEIKLNKQKSLALKWIISSIVEKKENFFQIKMSKEFLDIYNMSGKAITFCENYHKIAETNKMYIQFRF